MTGVTKIGQCSSGKLLLSRPKISDSNGPLLPVKGHKWYASKATKPVEWNPVETRRRPKCVCKPHLGLVESKNLGFCLAFASILARPPTSAKAHKQRVLKPYKFGRLYFCRASQLAMTNKKTKQARKKQAAAANGTTSASTTNGIDPCVVSFIPFYVSF